MQFNEMEDEQRRIFIDSEQLYKNYIALYHKSLAYKGGMQWKRSKGHEYLFKTHNRYGDGKSIGLRSSKTERVKEEFSRSKEKNKTLLSKAKEGLKNQARYCRAARIQRVPRIVTSILRNLDQAKILGKNILVVGTNALFAYEANAGVFLDSSSLATKDMDILWDIRPKLSIALEGETDQFGLINILRKADRTFNLTATGSYRAVNKDGYLVDLIKPEPKPAFLEERKQMGGVDDLSAVEIRNLEWLLSSPKLSQVVIGDDGYPATMVVPDPRAFALHKLWLSNQDDREPIKKKRDYNQALITLHLVIQYLPQYPFKSSELLMFPHEVVEKAVKIINSNQLPNGF